MNIKTANRLVELRKKHGYSQEELASELKLSRQTISKWERSEASPDTDNLIALANLYNMSLDELLGINEEKYDEEDLSSSVDQDVSDKEAPKDEEKDNDEEKSGIYIDKDGVRINNIRIDDTGVYGDDFSVSEGGVHVKNVHISSDALDDDDDGFSNIPHGRQFKKFIQKTKKTKLQHDIVAILRGVCLFLALVAFLLVGFLTEDGWRWGWTLLLAFDIIPSLVNAIFTRRFCAFDIMMTVLFIYLLCGMLLGAWHPNWVLFLIIPLYYTILGPIDTIILTKRVEKWSKEAIIDGDITIE